MKKNLILILSLILLFSMTVGCGNKKDNIKDDNVKVNANEKIIRDKIFNKFKFKETSLVYENNKFKLITLVTNKSKNTEYLKGFKIHTKDKKENDMFIFSEYVEKNIEPNDSITITSTFDDDLTNAYRIEYEVIK